MKKTKISKFIEPELKSESESTFDTELMANLESGSDSGSPILTYLFFILHKLIFICTYLYKC